MRRSLMAAVCCTLGFALSLHAQQAPSTGLTAPAQTLRFDEVAVANGAAVTNQFAAYGVSFTGLYMSFAGYLGAGPMLANFLPNNLCPVGGCASPVSIFFAQAVGGAAFRALTNEGTSLVEAYLNGTLVSSFSAPMYGTVQGLGVWYGFENIALDEIRVHAGGFNSGVDFDDLQIAAPVHVTPEPVSMLLLGSGLAGIAAARRRRKKQAE